MRKTITITKPNKPKQPRRKQNKDSKSTNPGVDRGRKVVTKPPKINKKKGTHNVIVRHSEFVMSLMNSVDFQAYEFSSNPTAQNFPWLSSIAGAFEKFRWRYLRLRYETASSSLIPGDVMVYFDYDSTASLPLNSNLMLNQYKSTSVAVWKNFTCSADPSRFDSNKSYYIYNPNLPMTESLTLLSTPYLIFLAIEGTEEEGLAGRVYLDYEIELMVPTVRNILPQSGVEFTLLGCPWTSGTPTLNAATSMINARGSLPVQFGSGTIIIFPSGFCGSFLFYAKVQNGFDVGSPPVFTATNGSLYFDGWTLSDTIISGVDEWVYWARVQIQPGGYIRQTTNLGSVDLSQNEVRFVFGAWTPQYINSTSPNWVSPFLSAPSTKRKLRLAPSWDCSTCELIEDSEDGTK